jgi:hypothetical protein
MKMVRRALGFAMVMTGLFTVMGCDGGYTEAKAEERCQQEMASKAQCVTDAAYQECVACYEECGTQCLAQATCPETYTCQP